MNDDEDDLVLFDTEDEDDYDNNEKEELEWAACPLNKVTPLERGSHSKEEFPKATHLTAIQTSKLVLPWAQLPKQNRWRWVSSHC